MAWEKRNIDTKFYETKYLYSDEEIGLAGRLISGDKSLADKVDALMNKFRDIEFGKKPLEEHMAEIGRFYSISQYSKYDLSALAICAACKKDKESQDYAEQIFPVHPIIVADHMYTKQSNRKKYFGPIGSLLNKLLYNRDKNAADEKMATNLGHHVFGLKDVVNALEDFKSKFKFSINREAVERHKKEKPELFDN